MSNELKIAGSFSSSNYFEASNSVDSFNTLNVSTNIGKVNFSAGIGTNTSYKPTSMGQNLATNLAFESKLKYNITDSLNTQFRFRKIGDAEQYRVTFGGNYKIDKNNSIYSAAHLTTKHSNNSFKTNTGAWAGYTHKFDNCSLSIELQQNIPFKGKLQPSDTMVNLIATIPF